MRIVFDEVNGVVADGPEEDKAEARKQQEAGEPRPTATTTDLVRDLRLIAERKARLIAD